MWISYCCRQDPRVGSLKKNKKRRRRFGVGLNEGGKQTSLWKQTEIRPQNIFRARTCATSQPYEFGFVVPFCDARFLRAATFRSIAVCFPSAFSNRSRHGCKSLYFMILRAHGNARAHHTCITRPLRSLFGWAQDSIFFTLLLHLANFCCSPRLFRDRQVCNFVHTRAKKLKLFPIDHLHSVGGFWACLRRVGLKQPFWVFRTIIISTACNRFWSLPQGSSLFWKRRSSSNHTSSILRLVYVLNVFTS